MNDLQFLPFSFSDIEPWNPRVEQIPSREEDRLTLTQLGVDEISSRMMREADYLSQRFTDIVSKDSTEDALIMLSELSATLQRLLQLLPNAADKSPFMSRVSDCCRLAAALHVFFPLCGNFPDPTLIVHALVYQLKAALGSIVLSFEPTNQLMLWFMAIGGVSACGMPERTWFVGHLVVMITDANISSWMEMREKLTMVTAHAIFCEDSYRRLYDEIVRKRENLRLPDTPAR